MLTILSIRSYVPSQTCMSVMLACLFVSAGIAPLHASAAPDLEELDPKYRYEIDDSRGDPFTLTYNATVNPNDPANLPALHDPSHDFYLFEPARLDGRPVGARPLVVYFHGADIAPSPEKQRRQIEHYVGNGFIALWLPFCDTRTFCLDFVLYDDNAAAALQGALDLLARDDHVDVAKTRHGQSKIGFVAHSLGAHVAARVAGDGATASPQAIILHDGAGFDSSIAKAIGSVGFSPGLEAFIIRVTIGIIEQNGWGWDDPDSATRTYQTKHALPLDRESLAGISRSTLLLALGAAESEFDSNAFETVRRIYYRSPSRRKLAAIVPHACASQDPFSFELSFDCPDDLSQSVSTPTERFYYSVHQLFSGSIPDRLFDNAILRQTTACLRKPTRRGFDPLCAGFGRSFTGAWLDEAGDFLRLAEPKYSWHLTDPDTPPGSSNDDLKADHRSKPRFGAGH